MKRRDFLWTCATAAGAATLAACHSMRGGREEPARLDAAAFHASRRFVPTRFGRIAYVERGSGQAALFLHGFPLNGFQWRGALERLSPYRRCLAPDFIGLGYTDAPDQQDFSPQAQTDMLVALLDALSIPSVELIANDSGGTIAQLFVAQHPARVRTLLLTNCDVHENSPPAQMRNSIATARSGQYDQKMARHLEDRVYARSPKGIGGSAYVDPANFTDEAIEVYFTPLVSSPLRRMQLNRHLAAYEPNPLLAIEPALRRCAAPTRMVWGTADPLFPVVWAEWLHRTLPESRGVRLVEGGKLFWPEERPDLLADEARALWGV
ncbi:alpha/beta hydrolase [Luteimonas sp. SX5]|uniref:Alpha/beta hydrolase n=2 Tax=Luteimonas galliterrae TaxID=2940486 RepID=A0ABT0MIV3_9GAMM|nr:alpha/beta hydrolase [Luteimonas galliterrae]